MQTFIYDHLTGQARVEELTGEALNQLVALQDEAKAKKEAEEIAAQQKAQKRIELLQRLSLTDDEAKLLGL